LAVRLHGLYRFDLWFDELGTNIFSFPYLKQLALITHKSIGELFLNNLKNDPNSALYYVFTCIYSFVFGHGKVLRFLSVTFSVASLVIFYGLVKEFFDKRTSLLAVLLLALSPLHVWYAQEVRVYSAVSFFSLLTIYILIKSLRTNKNVYWVLFTFFMLGSLFLSYHLITIILVGFISLLVTSNSPAWGNTSLRGGKISSWIALSRKVKCLIRDPRLGKWLISILCVGLCFIIIASAFLWDQISYVKDAFWLKAPRMETLFYTIKAFIYGYIDLHFTHFLGLVLFIFLFIVGFCEAFKRQKANAIILLSFFLLPLVIVFIFSHLFFPIYLTRQLFFAMPFMHIFIAYGLRQPSQKYLRYAFVILIAILLLSSLRITYKGKVPYDDWHRLDGVFTRKKYQPLIQAFRKEFREGDFIIATDILSVNIMMFEITRNDQVFHYHPNDLFRLFFKPKFFLDVERRYVQVSQLLENLPDAEDDTIYSADFMYAGPPTLNPINIEEFPYNRVWIVSSAFRDKYPLVWNSKAVLDAFTPLYHEVKSYENDGVSIKLLVRYPSNQPQSQ
jgi:hypothetical protein